MRIIKLEQMIHKETPMITEELYKGMNLFWRKKNKTLQFKDPFFSSQKAILLSVNA